MIATQIKELLQKLRQGRLDVSKYPEWERFDAEELISELREVYPVTFQERRIRNHQELGMARGISSRTTVRKIPGSNFRRISLDPYLQGCVFVSHEGSTLNGLTLIRGLNVHPSGDSSLEVTLKMGSGFKLDKFPDGWRIQKIRERPVTLSEDFMAERGWKFDIFDWPKTKSV